MRVIAFCILVLLLLHVELWWLLPLVALYVLYWDGFELIAAGFVIDAYFGGHAAWPLYTITITGVIIVLWWLQPRFLLYNE